MSDSYLKQVSEVARLLNTDISKGLNDKDAAERLKKYGLNVIERKRKISPFKILLEQFKDFLIIILIISAIVSLFLGDYTEGFLILAIVVAVAVVGFLNEYKAEKTIEALKKLVALNAKVRRNGRLEEVEAKELVPGDIVLLEEGQKIPADIRLVSTINLQINEASLTGESQPIMKNEETIKIESAIADRKNSVFSGTNVTSGKGTGIVVGTGSDTEIGKIATLVEEEEEELTPMQRKLDRLGHQLGIGILVASAVVFVAIFFIDKDYQHLALINRLNAAFIAAVALAVAAIPEGLAFVVRISLALGARRMAKKNALIRKLPAVEALGSTDVICSDKTGTLTKGEMTVRKIWVNEELIEVTGSGYSEDGGFVQNGTGLKSYDKLKILLQVGILCNNANLRDEKIIGDPTEGALIVSARKAGFTEEETEREHPRIHEIPFTSDRKLMTTVHDKGDHHLVAMKGATEIVLSRSTMILLNGKEVPLTDELRAKALEAAESMSKEALRVLGFAYRKMDEFTKNDKTIEGEMIFLGLQGMMDPPRLEIKETIDTVTNKAGMKVVMITGDHVETAKAVAAEIGIKGEAITGIELDKLSQDKFEEIVENISIYARVNPEHKIRIIQALKEHGHQVAMTGDGVNDAPAIKAADIGIAMGITGTDVSKEAADVILLDDHFITIVKAIEEGRGIFDNVRKFVNYLLSCNIAEVFVVLVGLLLFGHLPLTAIQLLFINIVTDGLPAIALGSDPAERNIMNYKPKRFQTNIVSKNLWIEMFVFGVLMTAAIMFVFAKDAAISGVEAVSFAFTATVVLEMVRLIGLRTDYRIGFFSNPWLLVAVASSLALQLIVIYTPGLRDLFSAGAIRGSDWLYLAAAGAALFIAMKLVRKFLNRPVPAPQDVRGI